MIMKSLYLIISDHSKTDLILNSLQDYPTVKYFKNNIKIGNSSANMNNAIKHAVGEYIKIMHQDDVFFDNDTLFDINKNLMNASWGFVQYNYIDEDSVITNVDRVPKYDTAIINAKNTIGAPSVSFFKNDDNYFDEELIWMNDCEMWYKLYQKYGDPVAVCDKRYISIRTWAKSVSNTIANDLRLRKKEVDHCINKYQLQIKSKYKYV